MGRLLPEDRYERDFPKDGLLWILPWRRDAVEKTLEEDGVPVFKLPHGIRTADDFFREVLELFPPEGKAPTPLNFEGLAEVIEAGIRRSGHERVVIRWLSPLLLAKNSFQFRGALFCLHCASEQLANDESLLSEHDPRQDPIHMLALLVDYPDGLGPV